MKMNNKNKTKISNEKEIENWWKQAERDLISAENNMNSGDHYVSAFMSQQAVEKALKALYIKEKKELIKTHSLSRIGKLLTLPNEVLAKIASLEPVYQETRYPDVASKIPAEEFEEKDALELLNNAREVLEWIKKKLS